MKYILLTSLLSIRLLDAESLYKQEGTDPSFAAVQESSGVPVKDSTAAVPPDPESM